MNRIAKGIREELLKDLDRERLKLKPTPEEDRELLETLEEDMRARCECLDDEEEEEDGD